MGLSHRPPLTCRDTKETRPFSTGGDHRLSFPLGAAGGPNQVRRPDTPPGLVRGVEDGEREVKTSGAGGVGMGDLGVQSSEGGSHINLSALRGLLGDRLLVCLQELQGLLLGLIVACRDKKWEYAEG